MNCVYPPPTIRCKSAFSLVELSIVLVILGLLVGGVLSGQSLIKASELRAIITEHDRYATAVRSFRDKYLQLPGDMSQATQIWGKNAAYCNGDPGTATTTGTCNGNGDGNIDIALVPDSSSDMFQFWHQLDLAGLIEGHYTGIAGPAHVHDSSVNTNVPGSRMPNAVWSVENVPSSAGDIRNFNVETGNVFMLGAAVTGECPYGKVLTPEQAWNIDTKMDDGKPASGSLLAFYWNDECSSADVGPSAATNLAASYRVQEPTAQCAFKFIHAF